MTTLARSRKRASERRDEVLSAAIEEFSQHGYRGGSLARIANNCEITQPYVLRLFGTKRALFLAALDRFYMEVWQRWTVALIAYSSDEGDEAISPELADLLLVAEDEFGDRPVWSMLFRAWAETADEEIATSVRGMTERLFLLLQQETGGSFEEIRHFWSRMVMMAVGEAMGAWAYVETSVSARAMLGVSEEPPSQVFEAIRQQFDLG